MPYNTKDVICRSHRYLSVNKVRQVVTSVCLNVLIKVCDVIITQLDNLSFKHATGQLVNLSSDAATVNVWS